MVLSDVLRCGRALRKIEEGAPEVMVAARENWPSSLEIDLEPEGAAVRRLLKALVAAARQVP
jgi:hypothetical protein